MISANQKKYQRKKRDASYYREYRKRKKEQQASNLIMFPVKTPSIANFIENNHIQTSPRKYSNQKTPVGPLFWFMMGALFVTLMTATLIYLSAPFYFSTQSKAMSYFLAGLVELSILVLVAMKVETIADKIARGFLVLCLSGYSLVPMALTPIQEAQRTLSADVQNKTNKSDLMKTINDEIAIRKEKVKLLTERGRITLAQLELQKITVLQMDLRNTIFKDQAITTTNATKNDLRGAYGIAMQRVILLLCNLFFMHQLVMRLQSVVAQPVQPRKRRFAPPILATS